MLEDKQPSADENFGGEHQVWYFGKSGMVEGRIGKNDIKGLDRILQIAEYISPYNADLIQVHLVTVLLYKFVVWLSQLQ